MIEGHGGDLFAARAGGNLAGRMTLQTSTGFALTNPDGSQTVYDGRDYSIWVEAPDGRDHVFTALTFATTTGTWRFDVPTQSWRHVSDMTGHDWLA